ncbi:capping protein-inhibiting regulator of actin dynamics-like [Oncorhynchus keta]|uniref:capping protein-inhibiting regulator of actin dynamics-like n=1 Tax=Oncorhynchus keta TaxID=8018 RepID=UPI00227A9251|nr:capping protein-inhibiting regulator of actin dynamics-like [Oncorhynchus keta]
MAGFYGCLHVKNSDCSIMASGPSDVLTNQDPADTTEECTGKKKSKFQTFKNLFSKKKRKEAAAPARGDSGLKCSQSSDNVNAPEPALLIRSEKDEGSGSKINMGNKALSHDSVFVSESPLSEVTEGLGVSQDSIHGKVKSLQVIRLGSPPSLLKQVIRLGSPPSLLKQVIRLGSPPSLLKQVIRLGSPPSLLKQVIRLGSPPSLLKQVIRLGSPPSLLKQVIRLGSPPSLLKQVIRLGSPPSLLKQVIRLGSPPSLLKQVIRLGSPPSLLKQVIRLGSPPSLLKQVIRLGSPPSLLKQVIRLGSPPSLLRLCSSKPVQRNSSLSLEGTDSDEDQMSCETGSRSVSPLVFLPVDFSQPASPMGCLDNTAARHRLAVRHKACTKTKKPTTRVDGRAEGESFQEERQNCIIPESVEEDEEEDVKREQAGVAEEEEKQTDGVVVSQQAERSASDEEDKQGVQQELSHAQDAPSLSIQNDSDSEECLSCQAEVSAPRLQTAPLLGSMKSLEPPTGDDFLLTPPGCEVAVEGGSLLQEVLISLKGPLTSVLGLEAEAVLLEVEVNMEGSEAESGVDELALNPQEEACLPSDRPDYPAEPREEVEGEPYESEEELVVEHFNPKEEDAEEINPEYLTKEDQDMPSVEKEEEEEEINPEYLTKEDQDMPSVEKEEEEEEINPEYLTKEDQDMPSVEKEEEEENEEEREEGAEVEEKETEEVVEDERREEEDKMEPVSDVPVQTALLEPGGEEDVTSTSVEDDFQQVPYRDPERACESPECTTELSDQTVTDQACLPQLPNSSTPPPESLDQPEAPANTTQDQEEPSVTTDQRCITSPSAATGPEQSPQVHCRGPTATEDPGKPSGGSEHNRHRYTIAPAWQRLATKELTSPSPSPSVTVPGAVEAKRDSPSGVEPLSPVGADVPASPIPTQSTTAPIMSPEDTPPAAQGEETPENLFGVRLRKTSVGMLRLGSESETPPASPVHSLPIEPQRASFTEPQSNSKPALPRKPSELDGMVKPKRIPDLSVGREPSGGPGGGSQSPSWISLARQKQRILKENSLEETMDSKDPAEMEELNRKKSIRTLTRPVNKDQAKPPGSPVKVLCSLEISKPVVVEKEGKRALTHPAPTALAQDEPPWLALAKKKAKAWSEMPQIVQ